MALPDHCTSWPDRLLGFDWSMCCLAHDIAYETGLDRLEADLALYKCVGWEIGFGIMAIVMLAGVRILGGEYWKPAQR